MILLAIKGGCSSVVERMLCMYEAPGSIPGISIAMFFVAFFIGKKRFLVEWSLGGKKSLRKCFLFFFNRLQWRNRLAHGTYRQYKELCRGCEFEPHLEQQRFLLREKSFLLRKKIFLPDRESNPGLPRDRRRSSPLDYRGIGGQWM